MAFTAEPRQFPGVTHVDATIWRLADGASNVAEVWPALGFNCYRWQTVREQQTLDLLFADETMYGPSGRSTRGGIPILFPFPNRIRGGRYQWDGRDYQLPLNDSPPRNAIHGFACRRSWRVVDHGGNDAGAWVTGEFQGSIDVPDCRELWPADYRLRVTVRLFAGVLQIEAEVTNPDTKPLPFGLGYHPYFLVPFGSTGSADDSLVSVPAKSYWVLDDSLPIGQIAPVDAVRDLNAPRRYAELKLDDVLTALPADVPNALEGLCDRATITSSGASLTVACSAEFREMVVFTPPHRKAMCVEPYTCVTDAINLERRGRNAGLKVLSPGENWDATVELRIR
jgi:aldose 1-epimerase